MARYVLTFNDTVPGGATPTVTIDGDKTYKTPNGPKLGSDLETGGGIGFGSTPFWYVIATITPEA